MRAALAFLAALAAAAAPARAASPIPVKVAVVVTFEVGADTGDVPGEFQHWAERERWPHRMAVPGVDHPVLIGDDGTIGVVAGMTGRASNQVMALVLSGLFDFSRTYWLVNGIAGVDPAVASIGSAAWARYVIDGDIAYEIDSRESDQAWPYGIVAMGATLPREMSKPGPQVPAPIAYPLNPRLVAWAFALTRNVAIPDSPDLARHRALYAGEPNAQRPPFVLLGESLGSSRYWYGKVMTVWAEDWTRQWTEGNGRFVMTDMEDQGFAAALSRLGRMGRVDFSRVLVLRTGSDFCRQPPGADVNQSLHASYPGYRAALEAAYRVGSPVVHELARHWGRYRDAAP